MPHLSAAVLRSTRASGFSALGVNVDDDAKKAAELAAKLGLKFPVSLDTDKTVSRLYDLSAMPSTVLCIDREGCVRHVHRGYYEGYENTYDQQIQQPAQEMKLMPSLQLAARTALAWPWPPGFGGCAIEPWVKPYEREHLADPIVNLQRVTLIGQHREHVYDVREGARGATGVQGAAVGAAQDRGWAACPALSAVCSAACSPPAVQRVAALPEDVAEGMVHLFNGGGVTASGPALLVRKSIADTVSLTGTLYVDMVSNASIDVVTTASPFRETPDRLRRGPELRGARIADHGRRREQPRTGLPRQHLPTSTSRRTCSAA